MLFRGIHFMFLTATVFEADKSVGVTFDDVTKVHLNQSLIVPLTLRQESVFRLGPASLPATSRTPPVVSVTCLSV